METLLALWKRPMRDTQEEWRKIIEALHDAEEEYTWNDQRGVEAMPPVVDGQQVNSQLKPWTKENAQRRHSKRPQPTGGSGAAGNPGGAPGGPDVTGEPGQPGVTGDATGRMCESWNRQAGTNQVAITVMYGQDKCVCRLTPRHSFRHVSPTTGSRVAKGHPGRLVLKSREWIGNRDEVSRR